jgi:hypothetical protein
LRATLCGGHICLALTPNGEIKIFGEGVQLLGSGDQHPIERVIRALRADDHALEQPPKSLL